MNRIVYLVMIMAVCLVGSTHGSRNEPILDQIGDQEEGPSQKLLRQAFSKVNMDGLNKSQREAMLKATSLLGQVKEKYENACEESPSYVSIVSSKMSSVGAYWQQIEVKQKVAIIVPVVGCVIASGAYFILASTQSGDISTFLNMTANITQGLLS